MENPFIIASFGIAFALLLWWAFKKLPGEEWQILASLPVKKEEDGSWSGINLTYYGFFIANAYLTALTVYFMLLGSVGMDWKISTALVALLLAICAPAAGWVARLVEKKRHTLTVGGASFTGIVLAPWIAMIPGHLGPMVNVGIGGFSPWAFLAALAIAYSLGEGLGRLACISFGCCYGKPLEESAPWVRRLFAHRTFTFRGATKKVAYAGGLENRPLIPIQAVTSIFYLLVGLAGMELFSRAMYAWAFMGVVTATQGWRFLSEFLRSDHRGRASLSDYQIMAALAPVYSLVWLFFLPDAHTARPDLARGLASLWTPWTILFLQAVWIGAFHQTGRSRVTASRLSFHVHRDRI